jgi:hypothetical protein
MRFLRVPRAGFVCTLCTILLLITVAISADAASTNTAPVNRGREFSGYFDVSGVEEQGELIQVTLHLKLFNHTDASIRSAIVALLDSSAAMTFRGNFQPVKVWRSQQFIEMSQQFTISKREFREWMVPPAQPNLIILFQDGQGRSWQKGAQISRRPLVPQAAE